MKIVNHVHRKLVSIKYLYQLANYCAVHFTYYPIKCLDILILNLMFHKYLYYSATDFHLQQETEGRHFFYYMHIFVSV